MKRYRRLLQLISIVGLMGSSILAGCGGGSKDFNLDFSGMQMPFRPSPSPSPAPAPVTPPASPTPSNEPLDNWHLRASFPPKFLNAITYGGGTFVAVGQGGTIVTSADGARWETQYSGTERDLLGIGYGDGTYVAVGSDATILTSRDGMRWTDRSLSATHALYGVAYGNGVFIAVGRFVDGGGLSFNSLDGWNWAGPYPASDASTPGSVVCGHDVFVAAGGSGAQLQTSPDGRAWTERYTEPGKVLNGVTFGADTFVAVGFEGKTLSSADGVTWRSASLGDTHYVLDDVAYGGGAFVAVGRWSELGGKIFSSSDGVNWRARHSGTSNGLRGIAYGNGTFVIVGSDGAVFQSDAVQ